jgi:hypothetical protein
MQPRISGRERQNLQDAVQRGFTMGVRIARFNMTKSMEDCKVTLERVTMAAKWDDSLKFAWICKCS